MYLVENCFSNLGQCSIEVMSLLLNNGGFGKSSWIQIVHIHQCNHSASASSNGKLSCEVLVDMIR